MPVVSKRQNRFFRAHEHDKGKLGKVAREFIRTTPRTAFKKLPETKGSRGERWYAKD